MHQPSVAVVILNWNGWHDTIACLDSVSDLLTPNTSIFVIDNASSDDSVSRIRAWALDNLPSANERRAANGLTPFQFRDFTGPAPDPDLPGGPGYVTLIQAGRNAGYAAGNNVGLRLALEEGFDFFWILNNDTEVEPDAVDWLIRRMNEDPQIGICGSTLIYHGRRDLVQSLSGSGFSDFKGRGIALGMGQSSREPIDQQAVEAELRYVSGAAMFVSRAFLEQVGLMEESYFLYWEEMNWAARAKGRFRMGYAAKSVVYHKVGASIGTNDFGDRSPLSDYYMARNRLRFCARYSPVSLPFALFDIARSAARWTLRGKPERAVLLGRAIVGLPYVKP